MANSNSTNYNNTDEWNMNLRWLDFIYMLIMRYGEACLDKDYETMYRTLNLMEKTISPKIDNDDCEKKLDQVWDNIGMMQKKDEQGNLVCYFPQKIRNTEKLLDQIYALLLKKLEDRGILTYKSKDPSKAMGNFGSS